MEIMLLQIYCWYMFLFVFLLRKRFLYFNIIFLRNEIIIIIKILGWDVEGVIFNYTL